MTGKTKVLYILISFLASVLLWIYVIGVESPEKEDTITGVPVVFLGVDELYEDHELVITSDKTLTVDLKVFGSIKDIAALNTNKEDIVVEVDLSRVTTAGTKQLSYTVDLGNGDVTLLDRSPYYLGVKLETVRTGAVEVELVNEGSIADGFIAKTPKLEPASLQITGPEELVNSVARAEVVWTRKNMDTTLTLDLDYKFYDADGAQVPTSELSVNYDVVTVTFPIHKTKSIPLELSYVGGAGATEKHARATIDPASITVSGDASVIDGLNSIVVGEIDLGAVVGSTSETFDIKLPNGVESLSGEESCVASVRLEGLATAELVCDNITVINHPEGLVGVPITLRRTVVLRGPSADIAQVEEINLRIVVDLAESGLTEQGRYTVDAKTYIDGYPDVGVLGAARIAVELMTEEEFEIYSSDEPAE